MMQHALADSWRRPAAALPRRSDVFQTCYARLPRKVPLKFAAPGAERQDSVANGFAAIDAAAQVGAGAGPCCCYCCSGRCGAGGCPTAAAVLLRMPPWTPCWLWAGAEAAAGHPPPGS